MACRHPHFAIDWQPDQFIVPSFTEMDVPACCILCGTQFTMHVLVPPDTPLFRHLDIGIGMIVGSAFHEAYEAHGELTERYLALQEKKQ
jgi:hypothetical protein